MVNGLYGWGHGGIRRSEEVGVMTDTTTAVKTPGLGAARISLVFDGVEHGVFAELVKLNSEVEPVDFLESTDQEVTIRKLPGKASRG